MFQLVVSHSATKQLQAELVINGLNVNNDNNADMLIQFDGDYVERNIQKRDRKRRTIDENNNWIPVKVYYNKK